MNDVFRIRFFAWIGLWIALWTGTMPAQAQTGTSNLKYIAIKAVGNNGYAFEQHPSFFAVAGGSPSARDTDVWSGYQLRAITHAGDHWYAVLRNGGSNCFVDYTSYANMRALKGHVLRCNSIVGDGFRGIAYDGKLFYTVFWDGSKHWWQSYRTWSDVASNNAYSKQNDTRNTDIYKSIGFDPIQQSFYSVAQSGNTLYLFRYATVSDMIAVKPTPDSQAVQVNDRFLGLAVAPAETNLDIYVVAGQSNAVGWDTDGAWLGHDPADANIPFFYRIGNGFNTQTTTSGSSLIRLAPQNAAFGSVLNGVTKFGIEMGIGRGLYASGRRDIAIVKVAYGGTTLASDWNPIVPNSLTQLLQESLAQATTQWNRAGYRTRLAGVFWMQGESDGEHTVEMANAYEVNLRGFIATVRSWAGEPSLPFVMGRITTHWPYATQIRQAQEAVRTSDPYTGLVNTDDLPLYPGDNAHFSSAGEYTLGQRMGDAFRQIAGW